MDTLTRENAKLSRTELRKQKLAEYLAAKGRLKPPNPKPYLKEMGSVQRSQTAGEGKENFAPVAMGNKNNINMGNALVEKNKDSANTVSKLRTLPRATSATLRLPLKATLSQTAPQHSSSKIQSKGTTIVRNASIKEQQTKTSAYKNVRDDKQSERTKTASSSITSQNKILYGASLKEDPNIDKTKSRLVTGKESGLEKVKPQIKRPVITGQPADTSGGTKAKTETKPTLQTRLTQKTTRDNPSIGGVKVGIASGEMNNKKPSSRRSQVKPVRSEFMQKVSKSQVPQMSNKAESKPGFALMQKTIPSTTRPRSCISTFSETKPDTSKSSATVKNSALQQRRITFNLPSKSSIQTSVPQTLPCHSKTSSQAKDPVTPKTPKSAFNFGIDGVRTVPLDGKKKPSAAQEERLRKLQEWRESKGITYKRPPMPVKPVRRKTTALSSQSYWTTMEQEDEVRGFVCAVDQSLNDCIKLIQQGCPVTQVRDVLSRVPMAQKFAKYWICQVKLMEREGNLDVLPTFEEAIRVVREPVDELRSVVFEILKKKETQASSLSRVRVDGDVGNEEDEEDSSSSHHGNMCTPKPVGVLIRGEKRDSSVIKYKITATPGGKRSQQVEKPRRINGSEVHFFTPVRRSTRIEKTVPRYPACLQEHDLCVTSYQDLLKEENESTLSTEAANSPLYVYRENEALKDQVQIQLVYE